MSFSVLAHYLGISIHFSNAEPTSLVPLGDEDLSIYPPCRAIFIVTIFVFTLIIPVVPHKAVVEVSKIGNL